MNRLGGLILSLILVSPLYGQYQALHRDKRTDLAPIGGMVLRPMPSESQVPPTTGTLVFCDGEHNSVCVLHSNETIPNAIVSCWKGNSAEDEVSSQSTDYTTAVTLTATIEVVGDYELMVYCEVAGSDTSTKVWLEADIDETTAIANVCFSFAATYAEDGWQPFMAYYFDENASIGDHTLRLRYKANNPAKTGYIRRARVRCVRVR